MISDKKFCRSRLYANNAVHPRRRGETSKSGMKKKKKNDTNITVLATSHEAYIIAVFATSNPLELNASSCHSQFCRIGFLPWYKASNSEQLTSSLSTALQDRSVLACSMTPSQTKHFMMKLWEDFFE